MLCDGCSQCMKYGNSTAAWCLVCCTAWTCGTFPDIQPSRCQTLRPLSSNCLHVQTTTKCRSSHAPSDWHRLVEPHKEYWSCVVTPWPCCKCLSSSCYVLSYRCYLLYLLGGRPAIARGPPVFENTYFSFFSDFKTTWLFTFFWNDSEKNVKSR